MKKIILLLIIVCVSFSAYSQTPLIYTDVVYLKDSTLSKNDIYNATKEWFVKNFTSAKDVIQLDDKENGKIIAKGAYHVGGTFIIGECWINFTLTIMIKDGKFKYEYTDLYHNSAASSMYDGGSLGHEKADCGGLYMTKKAWQQLQGITEVKCYNSMDRLKYAIETYSKREEEW